MFLSPPWWGSGNITLTNPGWDSSTIARSGSGNFTLSGGNTIANYSAALFSNTGIMGFRPRNGGKYYFEFSFSSPTGSATPQFGWADKISNATPLTNPVGAAGCLQILPTFGQLQYSRISGGSYTTTTTAISAGQVVGIAVDLDNDKFWMAVNNTWRASGDPANGTNPMFSKAVSGSDFDLRSGLPGLNCNQAGTTTVTLKTATSELAYSPPSGFKAWGDPDDTAFDA